MTNQATSVIELSESMSDMEIFRQPRGFAAGLAFLFSWLHAGGDPHGMGTPDGIWQVLRWMFWSILMGTIALTILARGRGRLLIFAAVITTVLADFAVIRLDFD